MEKSANLLPDGINEIHIGQVAGPENKQVDELMIIIHLFKPHVIAIEDFELRKLLKSRDLLSPVRVGHKLDYALHQYNAASPFPETGPTIKIEWQLPSLAMTTATDDRLKIWGIYVPGQEHGRDGERHVVTLARRIKDDASLRARIFGF